MAKNRYRTAANNSLPPLPLDDKHNYWDAEVRELVRRGFSYRAVAELTGLTVSRINTRVRKFGLVGKALAYRNGEGALAQEAIRAAKEQIRDLNFTNKSLATYIRSIERRRR